MSNPASRIVNGMLSKSLEQASGGQDNYPEEKIQELLSNMILRAMNGEDVSKDCPDCGFLADLMAAVVEHAKEGDDSPEVKACVSKKIPILINEGYGQAQSVAIAYSMCRKNPDVANKGKEVPEPVKRKVEGPVRYLSYADLAEFGRDRLTNMARPPVPIQKAGTSEGARAGWETRRGGAGAEPTETMGSARAVTTRAVEDFDAGIKGAEAARQEYDPKDKASRDKIDADFRAKEAQAGKAIASSREAIASLKGTPGIDEEKRQSLESHLRAAAEVFAPPTSDKFAPEQQDIWEEGFLPSVRGYLTQANDFAASAKGGAKKALDETPEVSKAGTSEGAKLGWETRRGGAPAEEPKAGMPSREKWDSMQSDADAMYDANDKFRQWQTREEDAPPRKRGVDPGPFRAFEDQLNALQDAAPKAAKVAEGLKGVPGVDEEKRSKAEAAMRNFASNGVGENDTSKYDDAVGDIWNMLDDARASHDPKYTAKTKEIKTMEKEVCNLANALFPKWISKGSKVAAPGEVKEIRKEFLTGLYKKRTAQEDMTETEGEVTVEKSVVSISRMPEAVETFAAPPANWQDGYTPIERQNLLAWVEAVDKARQTDVFRRGGMNAPFSPEFESMESRQSIGKWIAENPDPVAYYVAQNVNLASRPSVRTMKDRVVQIAQEITTMAQRAAK